MTRSDGCSSRRRAPDHPQGWHILNLDHEYDPGQREFPASCTVLPDWRTEPGALVCPERWSADKVAEIKSLLGAREWSSLHQQRPVPRAGLMFATEDFRVVDAAPASSHAVRAWDLAATDKKTSDQTAGVLMSQVGSGRKPDLVHPRRCRRPLGAPQTAAKDHWRRPGATAPRSRICSSRRSGSAGKADTQHLISAIAPSPGHPNSALRGKDIVRAQAVFGPSGGRKRPFGARTLDAALSRRNRDVSGRETRRSGRSGLSRFQPARFGVPAAGLARHLLKHLKGGPK